MDTNRSMPPAVIIPELPYPDVREAVNWLCQTFGFTERLRIGNHRSQMQSGEGSLVIIQGNNSSPAYVLMVRLKDVDSHYEKVKQAGARIVSPPADYSYGERQYVVEDIGGHRWTFSQTIADIDPATWGGTLIESS